ncbi:MAG: 30S ribosome-binding factor RbfA [Alphaproteobacteria bacterium]
MTRGRDRNPSQRQLRVGESLRHALVEVLARAAPRDPAVADTTVTVTEVRVSPDLRRATAFVVPLGGGDPDPVLAALRRAAPYLRGQVARRVQLKFAPEIGFEADTSFDAATRIDALLHEPDVAADLARAREDDRDGA